MKLFKSLLIVCLIWQAGAVIIDNPLILPGLNLISVSFLELISNPNFLATIVSTFLMLIKSWLITTVLVLLTILVSIRIESVRDTVKTLSMAMQPTPTFAWLPVFMILFGIDETSVIIMLVFTTYWLVMLNYISALEYSIAHWRKYCKNLEMNLLSCIFLVYIPDMKTVLINNFKTAWNMSWRTLLALEVVFGSIGNHWGIGTYMVTVKDKMDISEMYATLMAIIIIGLLLNLMFGMLENNKKGDINVSNKN